MQVAQHALTDLKRGTSVQFLCGENIMEDRFEKAQEPFPYFEMCFKKNKIECNLMYRPNQAQHEVNCWE